MKTAGNSFSKKKLETLFKKKNIKNFQLIKGNVLKTVPEFLKKRPKEKIILLNVDIDFVESTECVLNHFYPRIIKGGLILLDNYQGVGTSGIFYKGETRVINTFLKKVKKKAKSFKNLKKPMYIEK